MTICLPCWRSNPADVKRIGWSVRLMPVTLNAHGAEVARVLVGFEEVGHAHLDVRLVGAASTVTTVLSGAVGRRRAITSSQIVKSAVMTAAMSRQ